MRLFLSLMLIQPLAALAQEAATLPEMEQLRQGQSIAERWCSACHSIGPALGSDAAPPFASIAGMRAPDQIAAFLARPHGQMPPLDLTNEEIASVIAYMQTLTDEQAER